MCDLNNYCVVYNYSIHSHSEYLENKVEVDQMTII